MKTSYFIGITLWLVLGLFIAGCSTPGQPLALSERTAPKESRKNYTSDPAQLFNAAKQVLVQQGFTIESADAASGHVTAMRSLQDSEGNELPHRFTVSAFVAGTPAEKESSITLAAYRQTLLHTSSHTWWRLFGLIPLIPAGTETQTIVREESIVTTPEFYRNFFTAVDNVLSTTMRQ